MATESLLRTQKDASAQANQSLPWSDIECLAEVIARGATLTGVPSSFTILTADQTVFTLAAGEVGYIQNLSADAPLAVKLGTGASTTSLNFIIAASTAASDGTGGNRLISGWIGPVSVAKMAGTASYLAWKQAP